VLLARASRIWSNSRKLDRIGIDARKWCCSPPGPAEKHDIAEATRCVEVALWKENSLKGYRRQQMATFVGLQDTEGTVFQINLDQIRYIQPLRSGGSVVYFDDQHSLNVVNPAHCSMGRAQEQSLISRVTEQARAARLVLIVITGPSVDVM
jgi:hypothetical protein